MAAFIDGVVNKLKVNNQTARIHSASTESCVATRQKRRGRPPGSRNTGSRSTGSSVSAPARAATNVVTNPCYANTRSPAISSSSYAPVVSHGGEAGSSLSLEPQPEEREASELLFHAQPAPQSQCSIRLPSFDTSTIQANGWEANQGPPEYRQELQLPSMLRFGQSTFTLPKLAANSFDLSNGL